MRCPYSCGFNGTEAEVGDHLAYISSFDDPGHRPRQDGGKPVAAKLAAAMAATGEPYSRELLDDEYRVLLEVLKEYTDRFPASARFADSIRDNAQVFTEDGLTVRAVEWDEREFGAAVHALSAYVRRHRRDGSATRDITTAMRVLIRIANDFGDAAVSI